MHSELMVGNKALGKMNASAAAVVCFLALFLLANNADLGDAAVVDFFRVGTKEEDETGGLLASIAKVLSPWESTWHGPSYGG